MSVHRCHAIHCKRACPPKHLMCERHWAEVPADVQAEVYRTVKLRAKGFCDHTWGPWWRAQAKAIAHVCFTADSLKKEEYLAQQNRIADRLERR